MSQLNQLRRLPFHPSANRYLWRSSLPRRRLLLSRSRRRPRCTSPLRVTAVVHPYTTTTRRRRPERWLCRRRRWATLCRDRLRLSRVSPLNSITRLITWIRSRWVEWVCVKEWSILCMVCFVVQVCYCSDHEQCPQILCNGVIEEEVVRFLQVCFFL